MQYSYADLYQMLMELDKEEIEKVREELKTMLPDRFDLRLVCGSALRDKRDMEARAAFAALIQKAKPDAALRDPARPVKEEAAPDA